jgi:hypothetical protein
MDKIFTHLNDLVGTLITLSVGGLIYLIRRVFTNQHEIRLLKADLDARDIRREESNKLISMALEQMKTDIQEVKDEVKFIRRNRE